jgi:hypothetical protein
MTGMTILRHTPSHAFFSSGKASECRRIDPKTGEVIEVIKRQPFEVEKDRPS